MKKVFAALVAAGLLVGLTAGAAAAAPGGTARNQVTTWTYSMAIGYGHTYNVVYTSCSGSVVASGWQWGADGNPATHNPDETIVATVSSDGTMLTFDSTYVGGWGGSPYSWSGTFPVIGGTFTITDSNGAVYNGVSITRTATAVSTWANHGAYVSAMGGGADAAHSCVGMPVVATP